MDSLSKTEVEKYMQLAIAEGLKHKTPYGALIANRQTGEYLVAANQTKNKTKLAHAEVEALQSFSAKGWSSADSVLITTCEPCPMCMGAIIWHKIPMVYFGLGIEQIAKYHRQMMVDATTIAEKAWFDVVIEGGFLFKEVVKLFEKFAS